MTCSCGRNIKVTTSQAGAELHCECGQSVLVPTLRGMQHLPFAESLEEVPSKTSAAKWAGGRGITMATFTGIAIFCISLSALFYFRWYVSRTDFTVEDQLAAEREVFTNFPPQDVAKVWMEFQSHGITSKEAPEYFRWSVYAGEQWILGSISSGIGCFCLIAALITYFSGKSRRG
ncbi:MAG: hypothetical protein KDB03_17915 [Planctomycetales bacterium]|nr:hypothetical protein [Planctomycetales bacterium]